MSPDAARDTGDYDFQVLDSEPDKLASFLSRAILFVVACILAVGGYAVIANVFQPPAPRTQAERLLIQSKAAVKANSGDGQAWGQLARVQYMSGQKRQAYKTIEKARNLVSDKTISWVFIQDLDMLIRDGKYDEAVKRSNEYIKIDIKLREKEDAKYAQRGIVPPVDARDNTTLIRLFLMRASADSYVKKYKDAITCYNNVIKLDPTSADVYADRGWAKLKAGDKGGAIKDFKVTLQYIPDDPSATKGLATAQGKKN